MTSFRRPAACVGSVGATKGTVRLKSKSLRSTRQIAFPISRLRMSLDSKLENPSASRLASSSPTRKTIRVYMQQNGARVVAFAFHCRGKLYSFASNVGAAPDQVIGDIKPWLDKLRDASGNPATRRMVVVDVEDLPKNQFYRHCHFIIEPISTPIMDLGADSQRPIVGVFSDEWDDKMPEGFTRVSEYAVEATLIFHESRRE